MAARRAFEWIGALEAQLVFRYEISDLLLPAGYAHSARMAGPKMTLCFLCLFVSSMYLCACAIIMSHTLLPCDLTLVDFSNLNSCFV